jgi:molybdopterin-binding protein
MNKIKATIESIETVEGITKIVSVFGEKTITAITLEPPSAIKIGNEAFFIFKETEVGIAKNLSGEISFSNIYEGKIVSLEIGKMLSKIVVVVGSEKIGSIITTGAAKRLELAVEDTVQAFVKATEVSMEAVS